MKANKPQKNNSSNWQLIPTGEIFMFVKSYAFPRENLSNGILSPDKIGNVHYGDIHATFTSKNIDLSKIEIPIVKEAEFSPKKEDLLKDGDLIMADVSEDYDGIGATVLVHGIGKNKVVGGLHTFVLRDKKGLTSEYYRQYIFLNKDIRNKLQKVANGVSVYGISKTTLSKIGLPLPPLPEQNRIVSILETWDKSIEKLAKKIDAKKQIKKGLMQDLLTNNKRLKGFNDGLEIIEIGNLGEYYSGISGKDKEDFGFGKPFISYMNIYLNSKIDINIKDLVNIMDGEKQNKVKYGDLFFTTSSETSEEVGVASVLLDKNVGEIYLNSFCFGFRLHDFNKLIPEFAQYYFRSRPFRKSMFEIAQGATRFNLSKKYFVQTKIKIPRDIREQKAIADILTTADKEIAKLENKLQIFKEQKRYLLNNLITGTIRTPETLSAKIVK